MKSKSKQSNQVSHSDFLTALNDDGYLEFNKKGFLSESDDMILMKGFWHQGKATGQETVESMILIVLKTSNMAYLIPEIVLGGKMELNLLNLDALKQYQVESDPLNEINPIDSLKSVVQIAMTVGDVNKSVFLPIRKKRNGIISYVAEQPEDFWAKLRRWVGRVKVA